MMKSFAEAFGVGRKGGGMKKVPNDGVMLSVYRSQKNGEIALAVFVGVEVVRQMRWVIGERLSLGFDAERRVINIHRVVSPAAASWVLCPNYGKVADSAGQEKAGSFRLNVPEAALKAINMDGVKNYVPESVAIGPSGVEFPIRLGGMICVRDIGGAQ